jgi:cobaltochelatase CobT
LHRRLAPTDPVQLLVFELLEQFRVESLADPAMPGIARNLAHSFEQWSLTFFHTGLADSASGILLFTVAQMCRARVLAVPVVAAIEDHLESTRAALAPMIGVAMAGLRQQRFDQAAYAAHALAIAALVSEMIASTADEGNDGASIDKDDEDLERAAFSLLMNVGKELSPATASVVTGRSRALEAANDTYRVFTTAYDREISARDLTRRTELLEYRQRLDQAIAAQRINLPRLARALKALLARPQRDGWDSALEEGQVDGRRLAQLISSPTERRLFRMEHTEPLADCIVSLLIDCSGSIREQALAVAILAETLVRALEMAGVNSEVLGFTTGAWNGGRAQRDWLRAGRPTHPGRLNELCHIVFKDAQTSWRRARPGIAALLKAELFRESVDGEALDWACTRLCACEETRKLLIVVSDGFPMDSATQLANDNFYLDNHLRQVVQRLERRAEVEVYALGVALDLSPYYSHCHALDLSAPPGNGVFDEVVSLLARRNQR